MTSPDQQAGARSEEDLRALKSELLEGMKEYMREEDVPYDESDVLRCGQILDRFEAGVSRSSGRDEAVAHIHTAVLELNA